MQTDDTQGTTDAQHPHGAALAALEAQAAPATEYMPTRTAYNITDHGISVFLQMPDGESSAYVIPRDHPNFDRIKAALREKRFDDVEGLLDKTVGITRAIKGWISPDPEFAVEGGRIVFQGEAFDLSVSEKALRILEEGLDPAPILNFLRRVRRNPSRIAQEELFLFCIAHNFLIDEDGYIIAFKAVKNDWTDKYTGLVDNHVGQAPRMPRHQVDDRRHNTCSHGYHFGSESYARGFAGSDDRLVLVRVDPEHVVSIPSDAGNQKARCCEYTVITEVSRHETFLKTEVVKKEEIERLERERIEREAAEAAERVAQERLNRRAAIRAVIGRKSGLSPHVITQDPDAFDAKSFDDLDMTKSTRDDLREALFVEFPSLSTFEQGGPETTVGEVVESVYENLYGLDAEDDEDLDEEDEEDLDEDLDEEDEEDEEEDDVTARIERMVTDVIDGLTTDTVTTTSMLDGLMLTSSDRDDLRDTLKRRLVKDVDSAYFEGDAFPTLYGSMTVQEVIDAVLEFYPMV